MDVFAGLGPPANTFPAYVAGRLAGPKPAKPATVTNELTALRRGFTLALEAGVIPASRAPRFPHLEFNNASKEWFEDNEMRAVCMHLPEHFRPVVLFAYFSSWRKSEILGLTWDRVDFLTGVCRLNVGETKNNRGRVLPFEGDAELHELLKAQRDRRWEMERATGRDIKWVFFHPCGDPISDFARAWKAATKNAGCEGRLFHDLRRTAIRAMVRAGVSEVVAMSISGHRTRSVFDRYNITSEADQREAMAKVAASRIRHKLRHNQEFEERNAQGVAELGTAPAGFII